MASAVLARTTTNTAGARAVGGLMGKVPFSNPNPNPNFTTKKRHHQQRDVLNGGEFVVDESPVVTQSAASDDASSINHRRPSTTTSEFNQRQYVSFNVASYSKKQLGELKSRLAAELDQIRHLRHRLESQATPNNHHAPPHSKKSKKLSGKKRPLPDNPIHPKNPTYPNPNSNSNSNMNMNSASMKACKEILTKLRKHKNGWFNEPVDVVGMGLHDYHDIIKQPMDLGTVKSKLARNLYQSTSDFADDVRLTFTNALTYNPKDHLVYAMADQLLARFEDLFRPLGERIQRPEEEKRRDFEAAVEEDLQASDNDNSMRIAAEKSERVVEDRVSDHSDQFRGVQEPSSNLVREHSPVKSAPVKTTKLPKPKAKDPNKREMSLEEKHKLGIGLQSLPPEKMEQVVQIIRKRNGHLKQDGDEIELDIEAVDTETLWELDRLVTNWKKMVSKIKRQALMGNHNITRSNGDLPAVEAVASEVKKPKKGEAGDEDVDIGDEMPMSHFPPVEIEKDVGGHGSSSSSSSSSSSDSDSSSSSDSDSGSSSGSESDADNAQS